mgnify:FL=1|jgi:hypothetical protein
MTREKLDDFLSTWAALVIQFTTIMFALTFCSVGVMSCVKLLYRIFKMLFLNE